MSLRRQVIQADQVPGSGSVAYRRQLPKVLPSRPLRRIAISLLAAAASAGASRGCKYRLGQCSCEDVTLHLPQVQLPQLEGMMSEFEVIWGCRSE